MARRIVVSDASADRFGIQITHAPGQVGWLVGNDGDYMLFETEKEAAKVLKRLRNDDHYSWNCLAEVKKFGK